MPHAPEVLFVRVHNAGRSQLAAGLLQHYALRRIAVRSAGSEPAEKVDPAAAEAMTEWGLDITAKCPASSPPPTSKPPMS
jgi:arsenate reductase